MNIIHAIQLFKEKGTGDNIITWLPTWVDSVMELKRLKGNHGTEKTKREQAVRGKNNKE